MTTPDRGRPTRRAHPPNDRVAKRGLFECATCRRTGQRFQVYLLLNESFPSCPHCGEKARWRHAEQGERLPS